MYYILGGQRGVELRASHLLGRCCTTGSTPPALFAFVIFKIESHFMPELTWTTILFVFFHVLGMAGTYHCGQLLVKMGSQELFAGADFNP
jgi:hypothetical protein